MKKNINEFKTDGAVRADQKGLCINGEYKILLCGSLFYFRIPEELWRDRARRLRQAGYNCADVYFPWNFHENKPGEWDFNGNRDVAKFLQICKDEGLYVIARPGPYICSEWDGGALPAWVLTDSDCKIRENDSKFMNYVEEWFSRIIPILHKYEADSGGPVLMLQLDNELDFYPCSEPEAYIGALLKSARANGFSGLCFACAGCGNIPKSGGLTDGVLPTINIYPSNSDPQVDVKLREYQKEFNDSELPFLITETNRQHMLLKRQMAAGSRLLGAYNQVAGTNSGLFASINNWGKGDNPLTYITTDYDFGSMITAAGEFTRETIQGVLLGGLIETLGESLAASEPIGRDSSILSLQGGGSLISVPNLTGEPALLKISTDELEKSFFDVIVKPHDTKLIPLGIPLNRFGIDETLTYSSSQIYKIERLEDGLLLTLYDTQEMPVTKIAGITFRGYGDFKIKFDEKTLYIKVRQPENYIDLHILGERKTEKISGTVSVCEIQDKNPAQYNVPVRSLEHNGIYRGGAEYSFDSCKMLKLNGVADLVSVFKDNKFYKFLQPAGESIELESAQPAEWKIRVMSWGHSNYHDTKLDSLKLTASKGICSASINTCGFTPIDESVIFNNMRLADKGNTKEFPLSFVPGKFTALKLTIQNDKNCSFLALDGINFIAYAILGDKFIGRLSKIQSMQMTGGNREFLYLPKPWRELSDDLYLLIDPIDGALLNGLSLHYADL